MVRDVNFAKEQWENAQKEYKELSKNKGVQYSELEKAYKNVSKAQFAYIDSGMTHKEIPKSFVNSFNATKQEVSKSVTETKSSYKDKAVDLLSKQVSLAASANDKSNNATKNYHVMRT